MLGDLGKLIVAKGFKGCPKSNKSPNLVTLDLATMLGHFSLRESSIDARLYFCQICAFGKQIRLRNYIFCRQVHNIDVIFYV